MSKYIVVLGGNNPGAERCNYVSGVDKNGPHFSYDIDEAITFNNSDRCVHFARALLDFRTVDVYSVTEETVHSFKYVW